MCSRILFFEICRSDPSGFQVQCFTVERVVLHLCHPLFVTLLAGLEIVFMVTGHIAPLDIGFGSSGKFTCGRRQRVWLMTIAALRDSLCLFRIMRHVSVRGNLLAAWRHIARGCRSELIERSVAFQASFLGACRCLTIGLEYTG
jgi:hypothetical protein